MAVCKTEQTEQIKVCIPHSEIQTLGLDLIKIRIKVKPPFVIVHMLKQSSNINRRQRSTVSFYPESGHYPPLNVILQMENVDHARK